MSEEYTPFDVFALPYVTFDDRRNLPTVGGIYFVLEPESNCVFYVGKAQNLRNRWGAHHRASQMEAFYRIYWMECDEEAERASIELRMISAFTPTWNAARLGPVAPGMPLVYRQTLSDELAAKVDATRRSLGLSVQEITVFALAFFCEKYGP